MSAPFRTTDARDRIEVRGLRAPARVRSLLAVGERSAPLGLTSGRLLVLVDVSAAALASRLAPFPFDPTHLVFAAAVIGLNLASGLDRSQLTCSVIDDLAPLAGHALVGFALATTWGVLTGQ